MYTKNTTLLNLCSANQLTGFYMMGPLVDKGLRKILRRGSYLSFLKELKDSRIIKT